ncbi:MAG: EAL domain-containing protein [Aeromonadaceae bacterium]|nr:EAL domain-containing protein [Aeromonadaceae bacterium]
MPNWIVRMNRQLMCWLRSKAAVTPSSGCSSPNPLLEILSSAAVLCNDEGIISDVNTEFERLSGYAAQELIGRLAPVLRCGFYEHDLLTMVKMAVSERESWQGQLLTRHKNGHLLAEQITICRYESVASSQWLCLVTQVQNSSSLYGLAPLSARGLDPLTGLLDRPGFYAELEQTCQGEQPFGFLSLDLKNFANINTRFSHQTGDLLLQQLAARLRLLVGEEGLLGRVGGDGFAVLLPRVADEDLLALWGERLLAEVHRPFEAGPRKLRLFGTLAGALWPRDGLDFYQLLRHTDMALFEARRQQRNYLCFSAPMLERVMRREAMQRQLLQALARWQHPELGIVSPADFIPLSEEAGLIQVLGEQLLEQACRDLRRLHDAGYDWLQMSVNRSTLEFNSLSADAHEWLAVLAKYRLDPRHLIFEITESIFMDGHDEHLDRIRALRQAGCQIAIDDFGTGFSALNYLRRYPMDLVKIDRSFILHIPEHVQDRLLLQGLIRMVHNLGMQLVVEGIERDEQQAFIANEGCAYTQGYLFSKPLAWELLLDYLHRQTATTAPHVGEARTSLLI